MYYEYLKSGHFSALDKILSHWVFPANFTHPFLTDFGTKIFPYNTLLY